MCTCSPASRGSPGRCGPRPSHRDLVIDSPTITSFKKEKTEQRAEIQGSLLNSLSYVELIVGEIIAHSV